MALIEVYPRKLIFFCETPSPENGQATAIRSDVVVQKLEEQAPDVVEKLETQGIRLFHICQKDTWQRLVGEDPVDAAKAAIERLHYCTSFNYNEEDESAELHYSTSFNYNEEDESAELHYSPIFPIREMDGVRAMFNTIIGYGTEQIPLNATYGDGTPIPPEVLELYNNIFAENCVDVN